MEQKEYRLAAIMYTDIAGFSRMMEENEAGTLETLRRHNQLITDSVRKHGGRVIKSVGDVFLSEFPNTVDAVRSAVEVQNDIGRHNDAGPVMPIYLRVGIHLGDIYFLEDDALGEGVSIANRLQSLARPGRICISQDVLNLVSTKLDLNVRSLGRSKLKNISREIETYEISVNDGAEEPGTRDNDGATSATNPTTGGARGSSSALRGALKENLQSPEYAGFNELKALVLGEIKRAGRRLSIDDVRDRLPNRSGDIDTALETLADKGFLTRGSAGMARGTPREVPRGGGAHARVRKNWDRDWSQRGGSPGRSHGGSRGASDEEEARIQSRWDRALEETPAGTGGYDSLVEDYKDHVASSAEREKAGLRGHLISYVAVNGGLFFLWSMVMFGGFPWFLIVALGWGIGLASHFSGVRQKARESRELDQWPGLTREQLRIYRKLAKARSNWSGHLVSNIATSVFLLLLNFIVSPGFLWAAFPIGFMAIGVFSHLPAYKAKERRLLKRLRDAGASIAHLLGGKRSASEPEQRTTTGAPNTAGYEA
ncbi:MAG: adenylate/guanylate cyclase domain-containing protein, partial [Spirochaetales bacterium]|nr:adenylate/guanylate cyclase domain-containing protein [Spirochaetales bacterium]